MGEEKEKRERLSSLDLPFFFSPFASSVFSHLTMWNDECYGKCFQNNVTVRMKHDAKQKIPTRSSTTRTLTKKESVLAARFRGGVTCSCTHANICKRTVTQNVVCVINGTEK